jgi:hypothetical protein
MTRRELMAVVVGVSLPTPAPALARAGEVIYYGTWEVTEITHYETRADHRMMFQYTLEPVGLIGYGNLHHLDADNDSGTLGWRIGYKFNISTGNGYIRYTQVNGVPGVLRSQIRQWKGDLLS